MRPFRIFFCHRTEDQARVAALQNELREAFANFGFEDVGLKVPHCADWQAIAAPLIRDADLVVCVVGATTSQSEPVAWELAQANAHQRPLLIRRLAPSDRLPSVVTSLPAPLWRVDEVARDVVAALLDVALVPHPDPTQQDRILSQYTTMVTSWEALVNRRQTVNTFYLSACAALLTGLGVLLPLSKDLPGIQLALGIIILALVGAVIAHAWQTTLTAYGTLSTAKAQVVTTLEQRLPVRLFDAEWLALQSRRYTSTTSTDRLTARVFQVLFVITLVLAGLWVLHDAPISLHCQPAVATPFSAPSTPQAASAAMKPAP
jgi:hypothetical protein